jgi:branched-subunit amino acid aminotransferase/4-amino-4-deoxychorismate lyase
MSEPIVYLNDGFVPASQAKLNIYDLGIVLGATLTEMTRTFNHKAFRLDAHVARLCRSLKYAGINIELTAKQLSELTTKLITANSKHIERGEDLGIVHFVTPGENRIYAGSAAGSARLKPTLCVHSFPLPFSAWRHLFTDGAHVVTPAIRHIPPQCIDPKTKNRSRLHWWLADKQSQAVDPKAITLLLDLQGNITECGGSNFLIASGNTIYSPTTRNILEGVSMLTVRELSSKMGFKWVEKDLLPYDVVNADEAFLTTTPYCIAPATKINTIPIGSGAPGPIFKKILAAWSKKVGMNIEKQIATSKR